jgi:hypothetical protein
MDLPCGIVTISKSCLGVLDSHSHCQFIVQYALLPKFPDIFISFSRRDNPLHFIIQNRRSTFGLSSSGCLLSSSISVSSLSLSSGSVPPKEYTLEA